MLKAANKLTQLWGWLRDRRTRTLLYHSISQSPADPFAVYPDTFRRQMRWLADSGLRVIAHAELVRVIREGCDIPRSVVLTFDDGFADFFHTAVPILLEFGFPATVFVPAGLIGQPSRWSGPAAPRELMSAEQIASACRAGFDIGSHSLSHASLTETNDEDLDGELAGSLACLREITGGKDMSLAYPYGRSGAREQRAARAAGYSSAYLAGGLWGNGQGSDPFALARDLIGRETSRAGFAQLVTGRADARRLLAGPGRPECRPSAALMMALLFEGHWLAPALLVLGLAIACLANLRLWRRDQRVARQLSQQRAHPPALGPAGITPPRISYLVAAWNERPLIQRCLDSLLALPYPDVEVVLCAGGSDGTYDAVAALATDRVIVLEQRPGEGKQGALARCFRASTGELIYLTDADCVITEATFRWCMAPLLSGEAEAVSGSFYLPPPGQRKHPFVLLQAAERAYSAAKLLADSKGLLGGNCALRRGVLEQAGAFDTPVRTGTDYYLAKRLLQTGARIRYQVQGSIQSEFPTGLRAYARQQARWIRNVVVHGRRFGATAEVAACMRTSLVGLAMLALPLIAGSLIAAGGPIRQAGEVVLASWLVLFGYAILSRIRYLSFARAWLGLPYSGWHLLLLPAHIVIDWWTWTMPLTEYASRTGRERW